MTAIATQTINLDLRPHFNRQNNCIVYCSQYDNDLRNVVVNIADAGTAVNVSTYTIYIEGTKPDKKGFSYELTDIGGTVSNNVVTFPLQLQMTACAGITNAELVFYSGDDRVGSSNFILAVEKAGLADDIDVSETDIPAYVDGAQQAAQAAEDAKDAAVDAKDTAVAVAASIPADYTTLSNDVDDLKSALHDMVVYPTIRNGSIGNPGNTNLVCTTNISPFIDSASICVKIKKPLEAAGNYYQLEVTTYTIDSGVAYSSGSYREIIDVRIPMEGKHAYFSHRSLGASKASIGFALVIIEYDSNNEPVPLRTTNFSTNDVEIIYINDYEIRDVVKQRETAFIACESGSFADNTARKTSGRKERIRNKLPICIDGYESFTIPNGYSAWLFAYDKDMNYLSTPNTWLTGTVAINGIISSTAIKYINLAFKNNATPSGDISSEITTIENGLIFSPATITARGVTNSITETKLNNARHTTNPLTLLHFSDLHSDTSALNRIMSDADSYGSQIDDVICTGDIVANTSGQITSWWNSKVMTCIGNHDTASYSNEAYNWTALSMADRDAYYIAPFESNWDITHTSGTSYYYKDYTTQKVRLIVMDAMLYSSYESDTSLGTTQTAWLANLLADAITNNLHVLIAIHAPHGGATAVDCSFSRYGQTAMPTYNDCNTPQTVIDTVATAIGNGLKFIGYIVGHTHQDNVWDAENDGTQLMYCVTCAAVAQEAQWKNSDQHRSASEDAYNLVTIDTAHTLVKIVRGGGADIDDHMRTRKAICFNYSTGQKVGEVL